MGNIKARDNDGKYKVVASSEATGITVRDPSLQLKEEGGTTVEEVLLNQKEDINKLKGNVSWLAKHGGGGAGGGGGTGTGPIVSQATAKIFVNNNASGTETIINEKGLVILFTDITPQATKNWDVEININNRTIAKRLVSLTNPIIELSYDEIIKFPNGEPTLTNHAGRLTINASYEDDSISLYGSATWIADIIEAVVNLEVSNVSVNLDDSGNPSEEKFINLSYSTGVTGNYTLTINASYNGNSISREIPLIINNTNNNNYAININEFITNISPGEYLITTTLTYDNDNKITKTVKSTVNFITKNLIISSNKLSDNQETPIEVSVSSSLNLNWSCFGQGISTFKYDYIVNGDKVVSEKNGTIGVIINDFIPITGNSWGTVGNVVSVIIRCYTGDKEVSRTFYFRIIEAVGALVNHNNDIITHTLFDFKAYKFSTDTKEFTISNPDYALGGYRTGIETTIKMINGSNLVGIKAQGAVPPSLRYSNGSYGKIDSFTVGSNKRTINQIINNNNGEFSFNICFKGDYHPDDERTILSIASSDVDGNPTNSVEIGIHNVFVNGISVVELVDDDFNDITVTFTKKIIDYINNEGVHGTKTAWVCKIFTDGTITAIRTFDNLETIINQTNIYIAGKDPKDGSFEGIRLTDCNIYSLSFYDCVLNDEDILVNYINNKILHTYNSQNNFDFNIANEEAKKSFCEINTDNKITSYIYSRLSDRYNIDFITKNNKLDQDKLNSYAKVLGIPIVLIDVSSIADWTFNNFIIQQSAGDVSLKPAEGQKMQYYDPNGQNNTICELNNVTVFLQGTSTLKDAVKNINISLPATSEDTTVFVPKATWLPEQTYTLKADVVDSSHSNNASIGKFINEVINEFFPYSPDAKANIEESAYVQNQQPSATLKHTVEGFPVLLIMKFRVENIGDISITPLGIYNFNLGRDAYHNLGFKKINSIKKDGANIQVTSFPFLAEHTVIDEEDSNANWIEVKDTYSVPDLQRITTNSIPDQFDTHTGDFWQTAPNILNLLYEVRYGSRPNPADYKNFRDFVDYITKLPIEAPIKVTDRVGTIDIGMISGDYDAYDYIGGSYIKTENKINMTLDPNTIAKPIFNYEALYRYFVIANIFGLVDNFGKNSTYRSWNDGDYYIGFYDMDTALGGDNQGELTIQTDCYNKFFKNRILDGERYGWLEESYNSAEGNKDANIDGDPQVIGGGGISARANKIWLSIDTNTAREAFDCNTAEGEAVQSQYAYQYKLVTEYLHQKAVAAGYDNFMNYFISEFYTKQCGDCGPLIFNLDYRLKYLLQFKNNNYDNMSYTSKLHGRKQAYTKYWLNNRITFLDSLFGFKRSKQTYNRPNDYNSSGNIKYYNTPKTIPVRFSTPLLFKFEVGDASKSWYFAPKNTKVYVDAGSNSSGSILAGALNNTPQLLNIGDEEIKLASMNVNLIGKNANDYKLNQLGYPLFIDLNLSEDTKLSQSFNLDSFYDNLSSRSSELRVLDFSNTNSVIPNSKFNLILYNTQTGPKDTKFNKLRKIDIHNSKCIAKIYIPAVPLRELNVTNSYIEELNLDNQNYLTYVDINGCTKINKVIINECSVYDHFEISEVANLNEVIITNNDKLRYVRITNCNNLTKLIIQNCPNLTEITVNPKFQTGTNIAMTGRGDSVLTLRDLPKLTTVNLSNNTKLKEFELTNCNEANITTFNLFNTGIEYITGGGKRTNISYNGNTDVILDLIDFTKANINIKQCANLQHVQFPNNTTPITYSSSFYGNNNLKRIYGNIVISNAQIDNGIFRDLKLFSIHGTDTQWKGANIKNGNMIGTPWEIIKGITDFGNENIDFAQFEDITIDDFYQSGINKTNIRFNGQTQFNHFCRNNNNITQFDIYYLLAVIAVQTNTHKAMSFAFYNSIEYFHPTNSPINRCMFVRHKWNVGDLRFYNYVYVVPSPKHHIDESGNLIVDIDNGLFSPFINATNFSVMNMRDTNINRSTFRRKSGNYALQLLSNMYFIITNENCTDMFKNLTSLTTINRSINGSSVLIDWTTFKLPSSVTNITKSFGFNGKNEFVINNVLPGINLQYLINSFTGTGIFNIDSNTFSKYPNLIAIGENTSNEHDYNVENFPFRNMTKTINQDTFPYDIFRNNHNLESANGVFFNVQYKDFTSPVKLPGDLFKNTPKLKFAACLFENIRFGYTLTPNSFENCPNLTNVRKMFAQEVTKTYRGGPTGEIPYRLFYHGHINQNKVITTIPKTAYDNLVITINTQVEDTTPGVSANALRDKTPAEINADIEVCLDSNKTVKTIQYPIFNTTINDIYACFMGCVYLTSYTNIDNQNPFINNANKEGELNNYKFDRNARPGAYNINHFSPVTQEEAYDRIMLGEVGDFANDPFASQCTEKDKATKDRFKNADTEFLNKNVTLNYICPRDLLKYCTPNPIMSSLFAYQGLGLVSANVGNLNVTENRFDVGINGTIPADLLAPVPNVTNLDYMFFCATNINTFKKNNVIYFLDPDFFSYTPNINRLVKSFAFALIAGSVNLNIFSPIKQSINVAGCFAAVEFSQQGGKSNISSVFQNNNLSNINGVFSANNINFDSNGNNPSYVEYSSVSNSATYDNNFTASKLPVTKQFVYHGQGIGNVGSNDKAIIPNNNNNY